MNVMFAIPPGNGGEPEGDGTRMIDNPNDKMKDGFASMRDCKVDDASEDQYSDNVMGILGETLTFENTNMSSTNGLGLVGPVDFETWEIAAVEMDLMVKKEQTEMLPGARKHKEQKIGSNRGW
jgi:hypothetical protein